MQKFLPAVAKGDKRIILVDGEPVGAINRVPLEGETRSNMHAGGTPEKVGPDRARPRDLRGDRAAPAREGPDLRRHRRDRRLADRDQRHLADRAAGARALRRHQRHREDLGSDRAAPRLMSLRARRPRPLAAPGREAAARARAARSPPPGRGMERLAALAPCRRASPAARRRSAGCRRCGLAAARRRPGSCSGCTAAPTASARRATHAALVAALAAPGRDRGGAARLPAARPSIRSRRRSRTRRAAWRRAPRRGLAGRADRARRRQRRRRARLRAAARAAGRRASRRRPACVAFSPWADLTLAGREPRARSPGATPSCPRERLAEIRDLYLAGADPRDPRASPHLRPLRRRAAGADPGEPRRDPARRRPEMAARLAADGVDGDARPLAATCRMSGSSTTGRLPEADAALDRAAAFLARRHAQNGVIARPRRNIRAAASRTLGQMRADREDGRC